MGTIIDGLQMIPRNMGIDLCRRNVLMAKKFLDRSEIRPCFQQMCGKGMPEHVGTDLSQAGGFRHILVDGPADRPVVDSRSPRPQKKRLLF